MEVVLKRKAFIDEINEKLTDVYQSIAENEDTVQIELETMVDGDENGYIKALESDFERDRILGHTRFGVHKDDFIFKFNGKVANGSASRGEVRSIILALKFIEAEMLKKKLGQNPIVLLDDVFSELDETRRRCLVKNFRDNQVIITSVESIEW